MNRPDAPTPPPDHPQAAVAAADRASRAAPAAAAASAGPAVDVGSQSPAQWSERLHRDWQPLPARAWRVFQLVGLLTAAPPALLLWWVAERHLPAPWDGWSWLLPMGVVLCAVWLSHKRHRWTFWKLDADGFAVRRGRIWQWDTRVPMGRVQHIDLKRGPLERAFGLASLVVHTAGTRLAGLDLSGIDHADAERVRDLLAREVERRREHEDHGEDDEYDGERRGEDSGKHSALGDQSDSEGGARDA